MNKILNVFLGAVLLLAPNAVLQARTWHVSPMGSDVNEGTMEKPIRTISKAAYYAIASDTVLIHEGVYREWVSPANGGINKQRQITYMAAPGEEAWIKGSEVVQDWKKVASGVWEATVPNTLFGNYNPFALKIWGDWLINKVDMHLGEVYLDNKALIEVSDEAKVATTEKTWFATVYDRKTVIRANFGAANPTKALTEINVRPTCFFPKTTGVNYITVKGLKLSQAATQWSPPTSEQTGIIGPNWSLGWTIENCEISNSKCSGICLGKERGSGQNMESLYKGKFGYTKSGFNREIEAILTAASLGWKKEFVGSHLIQNNTIFDCGQAGIVGHMGAAFSTIRNNKIVDINTNRTLKGYEIAGIKLHASIDVRIEHNLIINAYRGIWLDWQAQGTQVVGNVFSDNPNDDLFIEVSHGPTLVYNNVLLSPSSFNVNAQGIAFFNNLVKGRVSKWSTPIRYTPYHYPHATKVKGFFNNTGGDMRFYNNLFLASYKTHTEKEGLAAYNEYPVYKDDMARDVSGVDKLLVYKFPIWTKGNAYFSERAVPYKLETDYSRFPTEEVNATLEKRGDSYYLKLALDTALLKQVKTVAVNTAMLGQTFISEAVFENPDGTPFVLDKDYYGRTRNVTNPLPGPFEGDTSLPIWEPEN